MSQQAILGLDTNYQYTYVDELGNTIGLAGARGEFVPIAPIPLTAAEITNPSAAILARLTATYIGPDGRRYYSNGSALVPGYALIPAAGAWDGVTDDYAALQAQLTSLDGLGVVVQCPTGTCIVSQTLIVPNKVAVKGRGRRGTIIKAKSTLTPGTAVVQLGPTDTGALGFDCFLESLTVHANNVSGSIAVSGVVIQEGSGIKDVLLTNWGARGVSLPETNNANYSLRNSEIYGGEGGTNYGVYTKSNGGKALFEELSIVGTNATRLTAGIFTDTGGQGSMRGIHVEFSSDGILIGGNNSAYSIDTVTTTSVAASVTTLVRYAGGEQLSIAKNLYKNGATNVLKDDLIGLTSTDSWIKHYSGANNFRTGGVINTPFTLGFSAGTIAPDASRAEFITVSTLTANNTVSAPTNAIAGQKLEFRFVQDGTGGRTVGWNAIFHGVTLAASGTANQLAEIGFRYDGTRWIQLFTSGWVA
jgi:hypothetical protein